LEPGLEVGRRLFVENEQMEYEDLEELLVTYIQDTNNFIDMVTSHQSFRPTERQLDEYLDTCLRNKPNRMVCGLCIDNANPGTFFYGFKFKQGAQLLKMVCIYYGIFFFLSSKLVTNVYIYTVLARSIQILWSSRGAFSL
jgi:hypothetical protein